MFQATLNPMLVMCTCIIAGFILKRGDILPDNTDTVLSKLETKLLYPAQVLNTFLSYCTVASLIIMWVVRVFGGYVLGTLFGMGVMGVWIAMALDWVARAIVFPVRFMGDKWLRHKVI